MPKPMKRQNLRAFTMAAVLSALIIVMTVIPYTGYIYYGLIEITTLHIVVAIGGVLLGWKYGAWLGFVWGATCVIRAFTNPLWAPFTNPLISLVPRVIVGAVAGFAAAGLRKAKCKPYVVGALSAAAATLTNTVLVLSALKLFSAIINGSLIETIYMTLIGVNGLIELGAAIIIVPAVLAALQPRELVLGIDFGASATKLALVKTAAACAPCAKRTPKALRRPFSVSAPKTPPALPLRASDRLRFRAIFCRFPRNTRMSLPRSRAVQATWQRSPIASSSALVRELPLSASHLSAPGMSAAPGSAAAPCRALPRGCAA